MSRARDLFGASIFVAVIALDGLISTAYSQQQVPGFFGVFGGVLNSAILNANRREWKHISPSLRDCLASRGVSTDELAARGIPPSAPSVQRLLIECSQAPADSPLPVAQEPRPVAETGPQNRYTVEGLHLGDDVTTNAMYSTMRCKQSEIFRTFIWCLREREADATNAWVGTGVAALHSADGRLVYMWKMIRPASFGPGDIDREIQRLSRIHRQQAKVLTLPSKGGSPGGVIASWGDVVLQPIDGATITALASGQSPGIGFFIDFLGNLTKSAEEGSPIYLITGGAGELWSATYDDAGRGNLRMAISDASQFQSYASSARGAGATPDNGTSSKPPTPDDGNGLDSDSQAHSQTAEAEEAKRQQEQADQAKRQEAQAEETRELAEKAAEEQAEADRLRISKQFAEFRSKRADPGDKVASLLNFSTFGSNGGTDNSFWARKDEDLRSAYVLYSRGSTLQEPIETSKEVDVEHIDPSRFFIEYSKDAGVLIRLDGSVLTSCTACNRNDVQSRWLDYFSQKTD
jgi:hypothetical protein